MSDETFLFTVIMVDYDASVPREELRRAVACFSRQSFQNFELLIYHDGPKTTPYEEDLADMALAQNIRFFATDARENVWGHTNRDRGIRQARGEWIIHTNADNVFYDNALETIADKINDTSPTLIAGKKVVTTKQIVIFPIILVGVAAVKNSTLRIRGDHARDMSVLLSGIPVTHGNIDAMQFVMRRDLWLAEGGWSDTHRDSDGYLFEKLARKYAIHGILEVLGEHW
jgi:glycosyltransferase involved in cell wall biosynthesis